MDVINTPAALATIAADLRKWWTEEAADWDELVNAPIGDAQSETDLWEDLPTVDSKAVARTSPIFERHLGVPLDVKLIRRGGYGSIEEVIIDLVPKMVEAAKVRQGEPEK